MSLTNKRFVLTGGSVSRTATFTGVNIMNITREVFDDCKCDIKMVGSGSSAKPKLTLSYKGETLVEGVDYMTEIYSPGSYGLFKLNGNTYRGKSTYKNSNGDTVVTSNYSTCYLKVWGIGRFSGHDFASYNLNLPTASFSGTTRYDTCKKIVDTELTLGSYKGVIIASGEEGRYPDALCATSLSGLLNYPIVLVNGSGSALDSYSKQALAALKKKAGGKLDIIVVGGTSAVNEKIASQLKSYGTVSARLGGATRYDTALKIYNYGAKKNGGWSKSDVIIARGDNFADSLSISPYAAKAKAPILLVPNTSTSLDSSLRSIVKGYKRAVVVGGTSAVTEGVYNQAKSLAGKATRLSGSTRYETSAKIAEWEMDQGMGFSYVGFATGHNFPDSLASGFLQAKRNSVLLLVDEDSWYDWYAGKWKLDNAYSYATSLIAKQAANKSFAGAKQACFFGGTAALSDNVRVSLGTCFSRNTYEADEAWIDKNGFIGAVEINGITYRSGWYYRCNECGYTFNSGEEFTIHRENNVNSTMAYGNNGDTGGFASL